VQTVKNDRARHRPSYANTVALLNIGLLGSNTVAIAKYWAAWVKYGSKC
jgi:hypothetical protein